MGIDAKPMPKYEPTVDLWQNSTTETAFFNLATRLLNSLVIK
jgi:hypothetical protein